MRLLARLGFLLAGLLLLVTGVAMGAVGLMAMGTTGPKLLVTLVGLLLMVGGVTALIWVVVVQKRHRSN
jgi:hypothetical protein